MKPLAIVLTALVVFLAGYNVAAGDDWTRPVNQPRVCFPAAKWDADDADRPCALIEKVWEDGSVRVAVSQADGSGRYMTTTGARR